MTIPTQLALCAFLDDPTREMYGLEICAAAGPASGAIHPILARALHHALECTHALGFDLDRIPTYELDRSGSYWRCITPGAYCPKAAHNRYGYAKVTNRRHKCSQYPNGQ
ncbi:hypothetical protein [Streptosporangium carneum]|uniref:Uncharacterized protein n=1 Tax=Streptosporangium carneum TaxID=47481 RepID=A0A9W6IAD2_9ACTN|nr:hypothetical protein [Streptosporangium carneum]GLK14093.1 hypothetical protein GCM10017600_75050 [Streptosporangium carneum]